MIAPEARTLLAQKFTERGWPWFANDVLNESHHQWDAPLEVISALGWQPITTAPKYGRTEDDQLGICVASYWGDRWSFNHAWFDDVCEEWTDISSDRILSPVLWFRLPDRVQPIDNTTNTEG